MTLSSVPISPMRRVIRRQIPRIKSPAFYLHISEHRREIVRAGAEMEVVEDIFLHCCYIWVGRLYKVTTAMKQKGERLREHQHPVAKMRTGAPRVGGVGHPSTLSAVASLWPFCPLLLPHIPSPLPWSLFGG